MVCVTEVHEQHGSFFGGACYRYFMCNPVLPSKATLGSIPGFSPMLVFVAGKCPEGVGCSKEYIKGTTATTPEITSTRMPPSSLDSGSRSDGVG